MHGVLRDRVVLTKPGLELKRELLQVSTAEVAALLSCDSCSMSLSSLVSFLLALTNTRLAS